MLFSKFQIQNLSRTESQVLVRDSKFQRKSSGFSLIEMLVTTSIIAIISGIVLFSFPSFASTIVLENLTHEIALVVRQAQVYGIGIRQAPGVGFPRYAVHFETASPEEIILFADGNDNRRYDGADSADTIIETFEIQRGNRISELCYATGGSPSCGAASEIDVSFRRPNPDANIEVVPLDGGVVSYARITVSPPEGSDNEPRYIYIWSSGQIAVTSAE